MYATTAAGSASATGALVGGTGLAGSSLIPVGGHAAGVTGALAFTGPAIPYVQMLMFALLLISLGLMMIHATRLRRGQIATAAPVFER